MVLEGKSVFGGIAIGKLMVYEKEDHAVRQSRITDVEAEIRRFYEAKQEAQRQLSYFYEKAVKEAGEETAAIFEIHQMMLDDQDYLDAVTGLIKNRQINAESAVALTSEDFSAMFSSMEDEYMKERAADVKDISNRVIAVLQGNTERILTEDEPVILLADDLAPSETIQLDKSRVLSFVTRYGSSNSHTAILARTMNIPALTGVDFPRKEKEEFSVRGESSVTQTETDKDIWGRINGRLGIVDGYQGKIYIDPDQETLKKYEKLKAEDEKKKCLLQDLKGKENVTLDGKKINLYANIGSVGDLEKALASDAGGIGLFRSEFLYLESGDFPTEEAQFAAYRTVVEKMAGKKVIIRTLDIGADKQADYFKLEKETNPAMGYRAIRICLDRKDIFKTQLRAIYRASCYGMVSVMFPMIISVAEVREIKKIIEEVKAELDRDGLPYKDVETGIMIETPAAALISDMLAKEVDFFSVGTNDLTQYTLAIDRQNPKLDSIYDPHHEAVLRMLQMIVDNGHREGCWVGICGELGADTDMTESFLRMGFDEISVSPSMVLPVRDTIRKINLSSTG